MLESFNFKQNSKTFRTDWDLHLEVARFKASKFKCCFSL